MKVSVHLRSGSNKTNTRSEALADALEAAGHKIVRVPRGESLPDVDLVVQTGFAKSPALMGAIDKGIPYIIMEAPFWRDFYDLMDASSWGYNGLAGGAWTPPPPSDERPKPDLKPMKDSGKTLIIGQKPTDHSLRGSDHVEWILHTRASLPEADFRPHPLMVPERTLEPIRDAPVPYRRVVTYTSTVGAEALVEGCEVRADHRSSLVSGVTNREQWHHELSWRQAPNSRLHQLVPYILSGYEEARGRIREGQCEIPREKVDGPAICKRYYKLIV